jgi:arginine-tRNA-protein transferase
LYFVLRWVPFEVAKPLLDKKPYSVLSNISKVSSSSSSPQASETLLESTSEHEDMEQGDTNDDDDEMYNSDEDSDSDSSSSRNRSDITNILISLNGPRLRYKVLSVSLSLLSPVFFPDNQILNLCKNCT